MNNKKHKASTALIAAIFVFYIIACAIVIVAGINLYKKSFDIAEKNYNARTSILYIMEKLRQSGSLKNLHITEFNANDAIVFSNEMNGKQYETWIYMENGYLTEALISSKANMIKGIGQKIMKISTFDVSIADETIAFTILDDNGNKFKSCMFID